MKKLLFCMINMNRGGAQRVLVNLVNNLDPNKYDITVLTLNDDGDLQGELGAHIRFRSIVKAKNKLLRTLLSYLIRRVIPPAWIAKAWIGGGYDYEIAYLEGECTRLIASHKIPKEKKIAWVHVNMMVITGSQALFKSIEDHADAYRQFGRIVCVSDGVREAFYERFGYFKNAEVLYNVVDDRMIEAKASETVAPWRGPGVNILMVGNLRKEKAYDRMLRVCQRLRQDGLDFTVTILGDGAEKDEIEKLRVQAGLTEAVHMLGAVQNPYPYMKQADLLVCSSLQEGFSTVVIEALLLGLPALTTDCSGMREILEDGKYGIIVENEENALYEGLKRILFDEALLTPYREILPQRKVFFSTNKRIEETEKLFLE